MQIAIVGVGTMGTGIAQAVAMGGDAVILHDQDPQALRVALGTISRGIDQATRLGKISSHQARRARRAFTITTDLERCAPASLIIEAVSNDPAIKAEVIRLLDACMAPDAILATTTNSLSITGLARSSARPARVIGLHFCRPAHIMPLVEVVRTDHTDQQVLDQALALLRKIGKRPVMVEDMPGLVVNRIALAYYGEALSLLDQNHSLEIETVDRLMEAAGFPMGPFRLIDYLGVDTVFAVSEAIYTATYQAAPYRPHPRLRRLMEAGHLGVKSGRGFYPAYTKTRGAED